MAPVPAGFGNRIYDILVAVCGAHEHDRASFVSHFERPVGNGPTSEWRFMGTFGFGGKFRYPRMTVDGYPEDMNSDLIRAKLDADTKLAVLAGKMRSAGWKS